MSGGTLSSPKARVLRSVRGLWQKLPYGFRYRFWRLAGQGLQRAYARSQLARPAARANALGEGPLVVAGLFRTANGIGAAARSTFRALEAAGLKPLAVDLSSQLATVDMESPVPCVPLPDSQQGTLILQLNGPETIAALEHLGMNKGRDWFTVGYWAWELPGFPAGWKSAFPFVSEIWAISAFTADAIRQHPKTPHVEVFPHAITPPEEVSPNRSAFDMPEDAFVFLTMADSMSSLERKNPFATISAFREAFGTSPDHVLVVKTRNLDRHKGAASDLATAIGDAPNIHLLDVSLSEDGLWSLIDSADCLVSLHRAEGFGLTIAEAMKLGKPVVCTDWSGNMDFTNNAVAFLVRSVLVPCEDRYGIYPSRRDVWAEVDHVHAVETLRRVAAERKRRAEVSAAGKTHISDWACPKHVGASMRKRLEQMAEE